MPIFAYQFDNSSRKVINIFLGRCLKAIIALAFVTAVLPERKKIGERPCVTIGYCVQDHVIFPEMCAKWPY